ncbi:hypothetical protein Aca07nite_19470 [Actinoplanes capillaceus]|uniref:Uncharacterized protein n=1 Tax=Actinoplanes campanulatus TaxID=113559 RepID=A0ABQ3WEY7_9ACTN|nr:hypothetical protein [Actinoplanes capillaceus]GID44672.1 hypothetical protein Aca07nite_19470 [Actinoplanes capillaceus]
MSSILSGRIDEIDAQIDGVHRMIEGASKDDPEVAAGLATTEPMTGIQRKIDQFAAAVEALDRQARSMGHQP